MTTNCPFSEQQLSDIGTYCTGQGCRVVRGPDWKWNKQDGGEGHVGSVRRFDSHGEVLVIWDSGIVANYRCGSLGFDLRVLDSSPTGVKHPETVCEGCNESPIYGIRWKCALCLNVDLCSSCYHGDKHSLNHQFLRIVEQYKTRVIVGRRSKQRRVEALGLFPKARVVRGIDWSWDNQDCLAPLASSSSSSAAATASTLLGSGNLAGGISTLGRLGRASTTGGGSSSSSNDPLMSVGPLLVPTQGRIANRRDWYPWAPRSAALVAWDSGAYNVYRVGYSGLVDLKAIRPGKGGNYYVDHLPLLADTRTSSEVTGNSTLATTVDHQREDVTVELERDEEVTPSGDCCCHEHHRHDQVASQPIVPNWTSLGELEERRRARPTCESNRGANRPPRVGSESSRGDLTRSSNRPSSNRHQSAEQVETTRSLTTNQQRSVLDLDDGPTIGCVGGGIGNGTGGSSLRAFGQSARGFLTDLLRPNNSHNIAPPAMTGSAVGSSRSSCRSSNNRIGHSTIRPSDVPSRRIESIGAGQQQHTCQLSCDAVPMSNRRPCQEVCSMTSTDQVQHNRPLTHTTSCHQATRSSCGAGGHLLATTSAPNQQPNLLLLRETRRSTTTETVGQQSQHSRHHSHGHHRHHYNVLTRLVEAEGGGGGGEAVVDEGRSSDQHAPRSSQSRSQAVNEELVRAAGEGNVERVKCLLQHRNADIDSMHAGSTALHAACQSNHLACVQLLLQLGAQRQLRDELGNEAAHTAVQSGNLLILKAVMKGPEGDADGHRSAEREQPLLIELGDHELIDNAPSTSSPSTRAVVDRPEANFSDVNARNALRQTPLHLAVGRQDAEMTKCLLSDFKAMPNLQDCDGDTPLHDAITSQNLALVELLLKFNPDLTISNNSGQNVLHYAAVVGEPGVVCQIVQYTITRTPWLIDEPKPDGLTALHLAAMNGRMEVVDILLQARANPNLVVERVGASTSASTNRNPHPTELAPLHMAVLRSSPGVVCLLLCHGARAGLGSGEKRSPMHWALSKLAQTQEQQQTNEASRRFDIALFPFLASVARLLVRMADSLDLPNRSRTPLERQQSSGGEQIEPASDSIAVDDEDPVGDSSFDTHARSVVSPSPLCRRLNSTIQATLKTGVPRLVLVAACLASAIGAESLCSIESEESSDAASSITLESFVTDVSNECKDPVLQLALQQCFIEAMNSQAAFSTPSSSSSNHPLVLMQESTRRSPSTESRSPQRSRSPTPIDDPDAQSILLLDLSSSPMEPTTIEQHSVDDLFRIDDSLTHFNNQSESSSDNNAIDQPPSISLISNLLEPSRTSEGQILSQSISCLPGLPSFSQLDKEWRECLICSEQERSVILSPCGHIVTCEKCSQLIKKCLLCRKPVEKIEPFSPCQLCQSPSATMMAQPCNHLLWCNNCASIRVNLSLAAPHTVSSTPLTTTSSLDEISSLTQQFNHLVRLTSNLSKCHICDNDIAGLWPVVSACAGLESNVGGVSNDQPSHIGSVTPLSPLPSLQPISPMIDYSQLFNLPSPITSSDSIAVIARSGGRQTLDDTFAGQVRSSPPVQQLDLPSMSQQAPINSELLINLFCPTNNDNSIRHQESDVREQSSPLPMLDRQQSFSLNNQRHSVVTSTEQSLGVESSSNQQRHQQSPTHRSKAKTSSSTKSKQRVTSATPTNESRSANNEDREWRRLKHELQVMREQIRCPICLDRAKNLVFMCGHATCQWCGDQVDVCPICRRSVNSRIILY